MMQGAASGAMPSVQKVSHAERMDEGTQCLHFRTTLLTSEPSSHLVIPR